VGAVRPRKYCARRELGLPEGCNLGTFGCGLVVFWRLDQMCLDQMTCYDGNLANLR
jgi:hypothetical protein